MMARDDALKRGAESAAEPRAWQYARQLDRARREALPMAQWREAQALSLIEGFQAQAYGVALRVQQGDVVVGLKLAFTNPAMLARLGLGGPMLGMLLRSMAMPDGVVLQARTLIRPRAEPEIAFRMAGPVSADASDAELLAAVAAVAPAIEIVDSRYRDFQFALPDAVADNLSACAFITGHWQTPGQELGALVVEVRFDDAVVASGRSDAILGHPLLALRASLRLAEEAGQPVREGTIVLAGAATDPMVLRPGVRLQVCIEGLGNVGCSLAPD